MDKRAFSEVLRNFGDSIQKIDAEKFKDLIIGHIVASELDCSGSQDVGIALLSAYSAFLSEDDEDTIFIEGREAEQLYLKEFAAGFKSLISRDPEDYSWPESLGTPSNNSYPTEFIKELAFAMGYAEALHVKAVTKYYTEHLDK